MISSKKITLISIILVCICVAGIAVFMIYPPESNKDTASGTVKYSDTHIVSYSPDDYYTDYSENGIAKINLLDGTAQSKSKNVSITEGTVTINGSGVYVVSGTLKDGCIIIDSGDSAQVRLVMNGAHITSSAGAAIYVKQAGETVISLVQNTKNTLTDAKKYSAEMMSDDVNAALTSEDDLVINGKGSLTINANYEDGIKADDTLKITEGNITINAIDEGINVNDYIATGSASITINALGDGIKCENELADKGFIAAEGTSFNIDVSGDGMAASSALYLTDISGNIKTGGGSEAVTPEDTKKFGMRDKSADTDAASSKGIKATQNIIVKNGSLNIDSSDDSIHSDNDITLDNCTLEIKSGDDGIHAEKNITLNHKKINITRSLEGIEAGYIFIKCGEMSIIASDDGLNALGNNTEDFGMPFMGGMRNEPINKEDIFLTIDAGSIYIECGGDGLDSNGAAVVNGGNIQVYGPENNGNSSLDFQTGFVINGGNLVAAGSRGMAQFPHSDSTQSSLSFYLDKRYEADSTLTLKDENGTEIITATPKRSFDWVCVSHEKIKNGATYTLVINGEEAGFINAETVVSSNSRFGKGGF